MTKFYKLSEKDGKTFLEQTAMEGGIQVGMEDLRVIGDRPIIAIEENPYFDIQLISKIKNVPIFLAE